MDGFERGGPMRHAARSAAFRGYQKLCKYSAHIHDPTTNFTQFPNGQKLVGSAKVKQFICSVLSFSKIIY